MKGRTIEIVGGGVAGLSLAIGLRMREVPVVLREAGSYPRHRLCGEFVNGVSSATLKNLGVQDLFRDAQEHCEMGWWLKSQKLTEASLERPVQALSRWKMDHWMSSRFQELGGLLETQERGVCEARPGLVWAAGRRLEKDSRWLGLKAHFLGLEMKQGLEMHLGDGGYVGLTPVEEGRVNVCGLFEKRKGLSGKGGALLLNYLRSCGLDDLALRLAAVPRDESSVTGISCIAFGAQGQDLELLAIGDAERMIQPFTGNGMSMAFEAAECALEPMLGYSNDVLSWSEAREQTQVRLQKRFRRRVAIARGMHGLILKSPARELLAAAAKPGLLPFSFLNRVLT